MKRVYLDHAAATPIDVNVKNKMQEVLNLFSNPSGIYASSLEVRNEIANARKGISNILNCHTDELIFTGTGTESNNLALLGFIKNFVLERNKTINLEIKNNSTPQINQEKFESEQVKNTNRIVENVKPKVITSKLEHPSVLEPLRHVAEMGMIEIIYLENDEYGIVSTNHLKRILDESGITNSLNIILISIMYASNELGTVMPVKEIGRMIDLYNRDLMKNSTGISFHIDAMQAGNFLDLDVLKLRVHLLSLNSAKIYGPKGIGLLYKKRGINISPIQYGGGQEKGLRSGTENVIGIAGLAKALEVANEMKTSELSKMLNLNAYLRDKLKQELREAVIYSKENDIRKIIKDDGSVNYFNIESIPNVLNIGLKGIQSDELVIRLSDMGFEVSHKSACASEEDESGSYVLKAIGASEEASNSNIRISLGRDTQEESVNEFIKALKNIFQKYRIID